MLSHLQIIAGDDIKLIILVRNSESKHHCYYDEDYSPLTLPIDGIYNDYGGICEENVPPYTEELLRSFTFVDKDEEKYEFTTVKELVDAITEGDGLYLYNKMYYHKTRKLECVFLHRKLYDILVKDFKRRKPYNRTETIYELYRRRYEKLKSMILELYPIQDSDDIAEMRREYSLIRKIDDMLFESSHCGYSFPKKYVEAKVLNEQNIDAFMKEIIDYIMFGSSLQFGRYGYLSRCGAGGQDRDVRVQNLIAKFVINFSKRRTEDNDTVYTNNETIFWYDKE